MKDGECEKRYVVCDQKGIITFFTTKKLEAIIIITIIKSLFSDLM